MPTDGFSTSDEQECCSSSPAATSESSSISANVVVSNLQLETPSEESADKSAATVAATPAAAAYTAVIYFHGMGSQRRFEETSRLVEALDAFARKKNRRIVDVTCHIEPSRIEHSEAVQYIRTVNTGRQANPRSTRIVRFYEGYWAPFTAKDASYRAVFLWLLKQTTRPYRLLMGSWTDAGERKRVFPAVDWRGHARLRRSALRELGARTNTATCTECPSKWNTIIRFLGHATKIEIRPEDMRLILRAYRSFEGLEARRAFPTGSFPQFRDFLLNKLRSKFPDDEVSRTRVLAIADAWCHYAAMLEVRNAAVLTTFLLTIVLAIGTGVVIAAQIFGFIKASPFVATFIPAEFGPLTLLSILVTLLGASSFFSRYLGDVFFWCTYEETDVRFKKRKQILDYGVKVLKHVLNDSRCHRVVVIGHSLGTAIAHEVLLEIGKEDWARTHNNNTVGVADGRDVIAKIEQFITAGSPIDKIHYFFESDPGKAHRYTRVSETIRGDMGRRPFGNNNNQPFLHWVNYWDKADIISGPLESPLNATDTAVHVDNVEVQNGTVLPGRAHTTYFRNERVLNDVFQIVFDNAYSFRRIRQDAAYGPKPRNYDSAVLGPGSGSSTIRIVQVIVLTIPWITAVLIVRHAVLQLLRS